MILYNEKIDNIINNLNYDLKKTTIVSDNNSLLDIYYFYLNNNYYCIYEENTYVVIELLAIEIDYDNYRLYVPINSNALILNNNDNILKYYFSINSFNDILDFYKSFNNNINIDYNNEIIKINLINYDNLAEDNNLNVVIDYKNKMIDIYDNLNNLLIHLI